MLISLKEFEEWMKTDSILTPVAQKEFMKALGRYAESKAFDAKVIQKSKKIIKKNA